MIKLIIAGSRTFVNYEFLKKKCDQMLSEINENVEIVSGTARGADKLGEQYAKEKGYSIKRFPADWGTHGKAAGYLRNGEMALYATHLICFWDGKSKGSKHMIDLARMNNLKINIVQF
jgi:hypothetical protein